MLKIVVFPFAMFYISLNLTFTQNCTLGINIGINSSINFFDRKGLEHLEFRSTPVIGVPNFQGVVTFKIKDKSGVRVSTKLETIGFNGIANKNGKILKRELSATFWEYTLGYYQKIPIKKECFVLFSNYGLRNNKKRLIGTYISGGNLYSFGLVNYEYSTSLSHNLQIGTEYIHNISSKSKLKFGMVFNKGLNTTLIAKFRLNDNTNTTYQTLYHKGDYICAYIGYEYTFFAKNSNKK